APGRRRRRGCVHGRQRLAARGGSGRTPARLRAVRPGRSRPGRPTEAVRRQHPLVARRMMQDFNQRIVEEFRANEGRVGAPVEGVPILLLHHRGARTGTERVNPLAYQPLEDGAMAVFGSKGGAPTNPDWFHNLVANPRARVEVGTETFDVVARVAEGEERERIWAKQKADVPGFAGYETATPRQIPVVILERRSG